MLTLVWGGLCFDVMGSCLLLNLGESLLLDIVSLITA